jgi:adenylate cyclase
MNRIATSTAEPTTIGALELLNLATGHAAVGTLHVEGGPLPSADPEGEIREVSMLMADLRGFTTFCERAAPNWTASVLNDYLTAMVDVILAHRGRVQDFVGDGILGVFGAPLLDGDHAWHAALSALEMQRAIGRLRSRWRSNLGADLSLGIALHTGEVFAGNVGSPRQSKYAVVGDPVNTVARLEELNKGLGTAIVMSGAMHARLGDRVDARARGTFAVRGRRHRVGVFELLGTRSAPTSPALMRDGRAGVRTRTAAGTSGSP